MTDELVEHLRKFGEAADALEERGRRIDKLENRLIDNAARIAELDAALREAYEVYAGSDGFIPETAAEGYQQQLIKQMVDIIGTALAKANTDLRAARAALEKTPEDWSHKNDGWR